MKRIISALCLMGMICFIFQTTVVTAKTNSSNKWDDSVEFSEKVGKDTYNGRVNKNKKICWVKNIDIGYDNKDKKFVIPKEINGMKVVEIGGMPTEDFSANVFGTLAEIAHGLDGRAASTNHIEEIVLPDSIKRIHDTAFSGLNIKSIRLPKMLKKLEWCTFYGCEKLKSVYIGKKLKKIDGRCFDRCNSLKKIKVSKKNNNIKVKGKCILDKGYGLSMVFSHSKKIVVPEGTKTIRSGVFQRLKCTRVSLPASLEDIEPRGLTSFTIKKVSLSKNNKYLKYDKQTIYRVKDKSLAVIICPSGKKCRMSDKIEYFSGKDSVIGVMLDDADNEGPYYNYTILPKGLKRVSTEGFSFAFSNCRKKVRFTAKKPPVVTKVDESTASLPIFLTVEVPKKSEKAYKAYYKKLDLFSSFEKNLNSNWKWVTY